MLSKYEFLIDKAKQDFGVLKKWTNIKAMSEQEVYENLKNLTAYAIQKLMEYDNSRLLELLYKSDISETKVKACFDADKSSKEISKAIAELYMARMIAKWKTRQEYQSDEVEGDWD